MKRFVSIWVLAFMSMWQLKGQVSFDGQASGIISYSPQVERPLFIGLRYIPEIKYKQRVDSFSMIAFEGSMNIDGTWNEGMVDGHISPYRLWAKYAGKQYEVRVGLQKIEFGSATVLRPLQWFNQLDPRDPLALTNGVYGVLARYYFLNNANVWVWGLYGNERPRGFDIVETNRDVPEYGGRIQYPVPKGELGITFHHRTADSRSLGFVQGLSKISENRIGLDGKWDVGVGLWFEATHQWKREDLSFLTNQTAFTLGMDYTFRVGNGLTAIAEHMLLSSDEKAFALEQPLNFTATMLTYPLTFFDNISAIAYYNWENQGGTFLINYEHQFKLISLYVMAYYNPDIQGGIQQNELVYSFAGPGLRVMAVYEY